MVQKYISSAKKSDNIDSLEIDDTNYAGDPNNPLREIYCMIKIKTSKNSQKFSII